MSDYYPDEFAEEYTAEPPFAEELTQLAGGPVRLPETADEFAAASGTLQNVQQVVANSPGAQQYFSQIAAHGVAEVVDRVEAIAGERVIDRGAAYAHANELYDAALRAGDTPEAAQEWALAQAAKKATGKSTYQDVAAEFTKKNFGKTILPQRKRNA